MYSLAWLLLIAWYWSGLVGGAPTAWLSEPARAAARTTNRDLELAYALPSVSGFEAVLMQRTQSSPEETLDYAIEIQHDVLRHLEALEEGWAAETSGEFEFVAPGSDMARAQLAVLLAERGELEDARAWAAAVESAPGFAALLHTAYGSTFEATNPADLPTRPEDPSFVLLQAGLRGYARDRVEIRLARAHGDEDAAFAREEALQRSGRARLRGSMTLYGVNWCLMAAGLAVIAVALLRGRFFGDGQGPRVPWSAADGLGVLVRGDFWNRLYFVGIGELATRLGGGGWLDRLVTAPVEHLLFQWGTPIASLPLVFLTWRHLLRPHRRSFSMFGAFSLGIAAIGVAALAIDLIGTWGLGWLTWKTGYYGHWAEGFDESLAWGNPLAVFVTSLDYVAWTPVIEELAFRGLLYTSLRRHISAAPAVLASATVFALLHFYSLPGFLMTFWSGLVWAAAYERAASLWPGIAAHAVYNALFVAGLLVVYR